MDIMQTSVLITGDYIIISEIMNDLKKSSILESECFKSIYFFASNTIFIDEDLKLPSVNFGIVSPKWEIIGKRKIKLDGVPGKPHSTDKANDGCLPGTNGEDGEPGLPGKPGGTFFGIGKEFVNGAHLTITANGGEGGPGQHGGNGHGGKCGQSAELPTSDNLPEGVFYNKLDEGSKNLDILDTISHIFVSASFHENYKIFGYEGSRGGNGGSGGKGGEGGNPGVVELYELNAESGIHKHLKRGTSGRNGRGGGKGLGGNGGQHIIARRIRYEPPLFMQLFGAKDTLEWDLTKCIDNHYLGSAGINGVDGRSTRGSKSPEPANIISDPYKIVNDYKTYLIKHLNCRFKGSLLLSFYIKINANYDIKSVYNTLGLIEEFQEVEHERARSSLKQSIFIQIYRLMLGRISEHAKQVKIPEDESAMKVLKYFYTTVLSKISILTDNSRTQLIIDLRRCLGSIKRDIEMLQKFQMAGTTLSIIKELEEDYNCNVNKRIEEVQSFIMEQILPEIDEFEQDIDNDIHLSIEETLKLQLDGKTEKETLIMKRKELEDFLAQKQIFNSFKFVAEIVSFLCSVGELAGPVIETATSSFALNKSEIPQEMDSTVTSIIQLVGNGVNKLTNGSFSYLNKIVSQSGLESFVFNKSEIPQETDSIVTSILRLVEDGTNKFIKGSFSFLNKFLGVLSNEIKNYPEYLQDLMPFIDGIKEHMNYKSGKMLRLTEIKALENILKQELKIKEESLKHQQCDQKSKEALKMIGRLNKIAQFGSLLVDFERGDKIEAEKLDELVNAIDLADKKFLTLKQCEEKIYNSIAPVIENIEDLFDAATKLDSMSQLALDIRKWQVQSSLKNVQLQLQELTERFKVQHSIARCFEILQETITVIIKTYDHIEYYWEQKSLANYIADLSNVSVSSINVSDQRLANALNKLKISLTSNLILKQYKTAFDAFNHWVFPFSRSYLEDSMLPSNFRFETNIETLVSDCVAHIKNMKKNVKAYKISVMRNDGYIHHGDFYSRNSSTDSFFVWKNEKYKYLISRLLSGQEIILKAEVKKSPVKKDAIKFNFIEFIFKCKTESLQSRLDEILKGFDIMATHTGTAYFRYANKIYLITSDKQIISYSFKKNKDGESVRANAVYNKIRRGDLILSPYTVWKLKLVGLRNRSSFDELKTFKNVVDLELAGNGTYVTCSNQFNLADEDYRLVELYDEFDQYLD